MPSPLRKISVHPSLHDNKSPILRIQYGVNEVCCLFPHSAGPYQIADLLRQMAKTIEQKETNLKANSTIGDKPLRR